MSEVRIGWDQHPNPAVIGYKAYWGFAANDYGATGSPKDMGNVLLGGFEIFESGTYHIAVTAYTATGIESGFSTEVVRFIALGIGLGKAN